MRHAWRRQRILGPVAAAGMLVTLAVPVAAIAWPRHDPAAPATTVPGTTGSGAAQPAPAAVPTGPAPQPATAPVPATQGAVRPALHTLALPAGGSGRPLGTRAQGLPLFSLVALSWQAGATAPDVPVQVRSRSTATHQWGAWTDLAAGDEAGADPRSGRRGTAALWVGDSDGVEWRVRGVLSAPLPTGARLDLIDPGHPAVPVTPRTVPAAFVVAARTSTAAATVAAAQAPAAWSAPTMISRAAWGADESLRRAGPQYSSTVKVVFVHHTTSSNTYACRDSAAIVRGVYAYHTLSLGWNDIGYNFLVDRCGTLFEGRYGGIDQPVIGAQTQGFNTDSAGVAVIGTFTSTSAPPEVLATVARVAAWKLALGGRRPDGVASLVAADTQGRFTAGRSYTFAAVSGHRDGTPTECPGDGLYRQLSAVRALAVADASTLGPFLTISGAASMGNRYFTTGKVTLTWTAGGGHPSGYTVLLDDAPAVTTGPDARSATLTLQPGSHRIALVAAYPPPTTPPTPSTTSATTTGPTTTTSRITAPTPGSAVTSSTRPSAVTTSAPTVSPSPTSSQTWTTPPLTVVADTRPPVLSAPTLALRGGTVNATGLPVTLSWHATDDVQLARITVTDPTTRLGPAASGWDTVAGPGLRRYTVTALDAAGNSATASTSGRAALVPETAATRRGSWGRSLNDAYDGDAALSSAVKASTLTWSFTGRGVAWVAMRSKWSGQARITLDGVAVGTVDLRADATAFRQAVWVRNGLTPGPHTVQVTVVGTTGRPTVVTDGVVVLT